MKSGKVGRTDMIHVLFTPRMYDSLPGLELNGDPQGFPTKDEIVSYLKKYVVNWHIISDGDFQNNSAQNLE